MQPRATCKRPRRHSLVEARRISPAFPRLGPLSPARVSRPLRRAPPFAAPPAGPPPSPALLCGAEGRRGRDSFLGGAMPPASAEAEGYEPQRRAGVGHSPQAAGFSSGCCGGSRNCVRASLLPPRPPPLHRTASPGSPCALRSVFPPGWDCISASASPSAWRLPI